MIKTHLWLFWVEQIIFLSVLQNRSVLHIQMFADHSESLLLHSFLICQF